MLKLGSLFDGAGGFPLAGEMAGITPLWASEIEPFAIRVTSRRFPKMKHLGNIIEINGAEIEPVDVITFGSPCQDLSTAKGKRKGLDGKRSGLFSEAIRIIKEMRDETNGKYPNFIVWENVPGAFSSNKSEDFRKVLEEICKIKDAEVFIPRPHKRKWTNAGEIVGAGYSVAWRTLDAQFWGVPQRRKRVFLVADFGGECAGKIQFERESLCGNTSESKGAQEGIAGALRNYLKTASGFNGHKSVSADICYREEICPCIEANMPPNVLVSNSYGVDCRNYVAYSELYPTLQAKENGGQRLNYSGAVLQHSCVGAQPYVIGNGQLCGLSLGEKSRALDCMHDQQLVIIPQTDAEYVVRRLTPLECCRLQGFPDYWVKDLETSEPTEEDIETWRDVFETHRKATAPSKKPKTRNQIIKWLKNPQSDSVEYKMWGNSIAIPCAYTILAGIADELRKNQ